MRTLLVTVLIFFCLSTWGISQPSTLSSQNHKIIDLSEHIYVLADPNQSLSIEEVQKKKYQTKFVKNKRNNYSYTTKGAVWLKFTMKGNLGQYLIEAKEIPLEQLTLYQPLANGKYQKIPRGTHFSRDFKSTYMLFPITLQNKQPHTFYIHATSEGHVRVRILAGTKQAFFNKNHSQDLFQGFFYGALIILWLYNLIICFTTRDLSYIYYTVYLAMFILYLSAFTGLGAEFLWAQHPSLGRYDFLVFPWLFIFLILFSNRFLNAKQLAPKYWRWSIGLIYLNVLPLVLGLIAEYLGDASQRILATVNVVYLISLGVLMIRKKYHMAKLYLLGWAGLLTGTLLNALSNAGILKVSFDIIYFLQGGALAEVVIFSFALANRIKYYQQENQRLVNKQNEILTEKIDKKTKELQTTNKELLTSNEELQQTQDELETQRDFIESQNKYLIKSKKRIDQSISAAQNIQQALLPFDERLQSIFKQYFVLLRPRDIVSGDFYWIEKVDDKIFVAAVDCTGHGIPGAFMSMISNTLLDHLIRIKHMTHPARILETLHKEVRRALRQDSSGDSNGMDVALCTLEESHQSSIVKIDFSGAKRPMYYIALGTNKAVQIKGTPKAIGGFQRDDISFSNQSFELPKGSIIYLCSDGYIDQNNVRRKKIGEENFQHLLAEVQQYHLDQQKHFFEKHLNSHMEGVDQRDDILLLGIEI